MEKINFFNIDENELTEYREDCFLKIKKDPEFYGLLLDNGFEDLSIKKYIGSCNAFYEDYNFWKTIKTIDDVNKTGIKYGYKLKMENGLLVRTRYLLPAYQKYMDFQSKFIYKDFDDKFDKISLKDVDNVTLKSKIKKLVKNKSWIYITGAIRSGRTFCAISLINASANKGASDLAFINTQVRFKELQEMYFNEKNQFNKIIDNLKNSHVLVFDGFGNEYINDIVRDNIVLPILLSRASNGKTTIFTSDFSINDIISLYSQKDKSGNNIKVKQLSNILKSMIKEEIVSSKTSLY